MALFHYYKYYFSTFIIFSILVSFRFRWELIWRSNSIGLKALTFDYCRGWVISHLVLSWYQWNILIMIIKTRNYRNKDKDNEFFGCIKFLIIMSQRNENSVGVFFAIFWILKCLGSNCEELKYFLQNQFDKYIFN